MKILRAIYPRRARLRVFFRPMISRSVYKSQNNLAKFFSFETFREE